jgi:transcriptional regulator with XRE-family HTH domain
MPSMKADKAITAAARGAADRDAFRDSLGSRLRQAREEKNVGLRELARRIGVSASLISQIETGKSEPSVSTLFAIVSELDLPVNEIVFDSSRAKRAGRAQPSSTGRESAPPATVRLVGGGPSGSPVQRGYDRMSIELESGVGWQRLSPQPDHDVDFLYLRYGAGAESTPTHSLMRHNGREFGYVLRGRLEVTLGFDKFELGPGDSIVFDCTQPHRFATIGDEPVEAVWFVLGRRHTIAVDDEPPLP